METDIQFIPVTQTKIREMQMGKGTLRIHGTYIDGVLAGEAFTLESLAHVMDLPMSTMDGRYKRGRLSHWKVDIVGMSGRPARGFPFRLLNDVIRIIATPGGRVEANAHGTRAALDVRGQEHDLRPVVHLNACYYTIPALAEAFNFSETTIRKKLAKSGLMRGMVNLQSPRQGGRPQRGFPESMLGQVKMAITDGVRFMTDLDRVLARATGAMSEAQLAMQSRIVPLALPPTGSLRAFDHATMAPLAPVNAVKSAAGDLQLAALDAELNALMAQSKMPAETATTHNVSPPAEPEPSVAATAEEEANRTAMVGFYRKELLEQVEEPDVEQYEYVVDALALDKVAGDAFVAEVKAERARGAA